MSTFEVYEDLVRRGEWIDSQVDLDGLDQATHRKVKESDQRRLVFDAENYRWMRFYRQKIGQVAQTHGTEVDISTLQLYAGRSPSRQRLERLIRQRIIATMDPDEHTAGIIGFALRNNPAMSAVIAYSSPDAQEEISPLLAMQEVPVIVYERGQLLGMRRATRSTINRIFTFRHDDYCAMNDAFVEALDYPNNSHNL